MSKRKKYNSLFDKFSDGYTEGNKECCWDWEKGVTKGGYGQIAFECKKYASHRLSWEYANNRKISKGFVIMHSCDNPSCVNPKHLSLGTQADNVADMIKKGRIGSYDKSGENSPSSVVKLCDVASIYEANGTHQEVADRFNYPYHAVTKIRNGITWKEATKNLKRGMRGLTGARGSKNGKATVDENAVIEIFLSKGPASIVARFHLCSVNTVNGIRNGKTWTHVTKELTNKVIS